MYIHNQLVKIKQKEKNLLSPVEAEEAKENKENKNHAEKFRMLSTDEKWPVPPSPFIHSRPISAVSVRFTGRDSPDQTQLQFFVPRRIFFPSTVVFLFLFRVA